MIYVLYFIHVVVCLFLILVVLLQQGKGADLSVFGGGSTMAVAIPPKENGRPRWEGKVCSAPNGWPKRKRPSSWELGRLT